MPYDYVARNKRRQVLVRAYIREVKESNPCVDCGKFYPYYVMDFDHLENKTGSVSHLTGTTTLPRLKRELEKCELVCANCHRVRTHARLA